MGHIGSVRLYRRPRRLPRSKFRRFLRAERGQRVRGQPSRANRPSLPHCGARLPSGGAAVVRVHGTRAASSCGCAPIVRCLIGIFVALLICILWRVFLVGLVGCALVGWFLVGFVGFLVGFVGVLVCFVGFLVGFVLGGQGRGQGRSPGRHHSSTSGRYCSRNPGRSLRRWCLNSNHCASNGG